MGNGTMFLYMGAALLGAAICTIVADIYIYKRSMKKLKDRLCREYGIEGGD